MTTNTTILRQQILNSIEDNTGIGDVTPNSKIAGLVDSFLNELNNIEDNTITSVNNMYIETANSTYLDKLGSQEGLSRIINNTFKLDKSTGTVQIESIIDNTTIGTIEAGTRLSLSDSLYVLFLEDIDLSLLQKGQPKNISVELRIEEINDFNVTEGSSYLSMFDGIYIKFNNTINVPLISEEINDFRNRVLFSRGCSKFGSEGAIRLCVASTNYVSDYKVDYSVSPPKLYLYHPNLLIDPTYSESLEVLGMNTIRTELNIRKADTTEYELSQPNSVNFRIYLRPNKTNASAVPIELYSLSDYIINTYKLGTIYSINIDTIKNHLLLSGVGTEFLDDYTVTLYKVFSSFEYTAEDNTITTSEYEYPFLEQILLTG